MSAPVPAVPTPVSAIGRTWSTLELTDEQMKPGPTDQQVRAAGRAKRARRLTKSQQSVQRSAIKPAQVSAAQVKPAKVTPAKLTPPEYP